MAARKQRERRKSQGQKYILEGYVTYLLREGLLSECEIIRGDILDVNCHAILASKMLLCTYYEKCTLSILRVAKILTVPALQKSTSLKFPLRLK